MPFSIYDLNILLFYIYIFYHPNAKSSLKMMHLRNEMQIFSLHWMMQNIRLFNVCGAQSNT